MPKSAAQVVREMREAGATAQNAQLESGSDSGLAAISRKETANPGLLQDAVPIVPPCTHVVVLEAPRCLAINASNGARCGAKLANRIIYVLGINERPSLQCWRCGTVQTFGQ